MQDITVDLPAIITAHIAAHNRPDPESFIATFSEGALLNDAQREFVGHAAIRAWADKEIFGDHVTMDVQSAYRNGKNIVVHARIEGDFDKTNLPDPVILTYYFSIEADLIVQLIILLNKSNWAPAHD